MSNYKHKRKASSIRLDAGWIVIGVMGAAVVIMLGAMYTGSMPGFLAGFKLLGLGSVIGLMIGLARIVTAD